MIGEKSLLALSDDISQSVTPTKIYYMDDLIRKVICEYMHRFVKDNWDRIDLNMVHITQDKESFLGKVLLDVETAMWIFTEVAVWGMDREYLRELIVYECDDFRVMKIDGTYIKYAWNPYRYEYDLSPAYPKTKVVQYFE